MSTHYETSFIQGTSESDLVVPFPLLLGAGSSCMQLQSAFGCFKKYFISGDTFNIFRVQPPESNLSNLGGGFIKSFFS